MSAEMDWVSAHHRRTDPFTSRLAAQVASYKAGSHKAELLGVFYTARRPLGAQEASLLALGVEGGQRRVSDLKNNGLITVVGSLRNSRDNTVEAFEITELGRVKYREIYGYDA